MTAAGKTVVKKVRKPIVANDRSRTLEYGADLRKAFVTHPVGRLEPFLDNLLGLGKELGSLSRIRAVYGHVRIYVFRG